jgi:hypothetical protein
MLAKKIVTASLRGRAVTGAMDAKAIAGRHQEGSVLTAINAPDCLGYYKRQRSMAIAISALKSEPAPSQFSKIAPITLERS